jgi:sialic acid synthase SpsE
LEKLEYNKTLVIAEVGNNHNGNYRLAKKSILEAKKAGADCVKFQYFTSEKLVHKNLKTLKHVKTHKLQIDRMKMLELSEKEFISLSSFAKSIDLKFCLSFFDKNLISKMINYVDYVKIASSEINNIDLLIEVNKHNKPIIISTGLSDKDNLKNDLKRVFKYIDKNKLILLHCISKYPLPAEESNLNNINNLKKIHANVGYSDHTSDIYACPAAVNLGAKIVEKHFLCYDGQKDAGDKAVSIGTKKFKEMVDLIRIFEEFNVGKTPVNLNYFKKNMLRSTYASKNLKKGSIINQNDVNFIRPFNKGGFDFQKLFVRKKYRLLKDVKKNELIKNKMVV